MKVGPKYKIARRLGAGIFEKTQTQKFALSAGRRTKPVPGVNPKSSFGIGQLEKQRARYSYLLTESQLAKYVRFVIGKKSRNQAEDLFVQLETRLDNIVLRAGFAPSRPMARQMVSHGHFTINGKRVSIPSMQLKKGDVVIVREGSKNKPLFAELEKRVKEASVPAWIKSDVKAMSITVDGVPVLKLGEQPYDLMKVLEFYKR